MSPKRIALLALTLPAVAHAADARHPTVIELFQSQGCSSCPPANANVTALSIQPEVLALSYAVTYWEGLGWKDVFAKQQFTDRQWDYARAFKNAHVWTPQVVINGRANIVGTRLEPLQALIGKSDRGTGGPAVAITGTGVDVAGSADKASDIWLVRYEPRAIDVAVKAGENGGKTLPHRNIVRELIKIGRWSGGAAHFAIPAATRSGLAVAAFVHTGAGGPIIAATVAGRG